MTDKTHKATVIVAPREGGFNGWFSGGKHWGPGQHDGVELTEVEINQLARRPGVVVLVGGKLVEAQDNTGPATTPVPLTDDEVQAVERYRAEQSKLAAQSKREEGPGLKFSKEKKGEAIERLMSGGTGGSASGISAATPLQDSGILHGENPPAGPAGTAKPIDTKGKR